MSATLHSVFLVIETVIVGSIFVAYLVEDPTSEKDKKSQDVFFVWIY